MPFRFPPYWLHRPRRNRQAGGQLRGARPALRGRYGGVTDLMNAFCRRAKQVLPRNRRFTHENAHKEASPDAGGSLE